MRSHTRVTVGAIGLASFITALQLLVTAATRLEATITPLLEAVIHGHFSALGAGWIAAYILLNGSTVAAIGVSFLAVGAMSAMEYFLFFAGSRMGAAFVVVLIGTLEYLRGKSLSLRDATSIGVLGFLLTFLVYIPGTATGYLLLPRLPQRTLSLSGAALPVPDLFAPFAAAASTIAAALPPAAGLAVALLGLFASLRIFDAAFTGISAATLRGRSVRFVLQHTWIAFLAGLAVTAVTTSVSISVGLLVPLYTSGYLKRRELVPYLLGANLTTVIDTLLAALVVGSRPGVQAILLLTLTTTGYTLLALLFYDRFFAGLKHLFDAVVGSRARFAAFNLLLLAVPLLLLAL